MIRGDKTIRKFIINIPFVRRNIPVFRELPRQLKHQWWLYKKCHYLSDLLKQARHNDIARELAQKKDFAAPFFQLFIARSLFLQNRRTEAESSLQIFLKHFPQHPEANYLYAEILALDGRKSEAWAKLENLLAYSKRRKTWQHLSNIVDEKEDFSKFYALFENRYANWRSGLPYDLTAHFSNAAVRSGNYAFARQLWKKHYENSLKKAPESSPIADVVAQKRYTDELAATALRDLKLCLDLNNIEFFLISGTLLGCIREGKLLGHDKDIDIGIWHTVPRPKLLEACRGSGCFYVLPNGGDDIVVVRHVNGITIDIFIHHKEADDYWHAGGKSKWHNTPFELVPHLFLGERYLIPENFDLYLRENYGSDWRIPNIDFDSALDTPNMEVVNKDAMLVYLYKRLSKKNKLSPSLYRRLRRALAEYEQE